MKNNGFNKLLDALKKVNLDENIITEESNSYNFNLNDFNEDGEIKKESQNDSQC